MAVSPLVYNKDDGGEKKNTAAKVRSLAVRGGLGDGASDSARKRPSSGPEIAEKMNQELKDKYVKGEWPQDNHAEGAIANESITQIKRWVRVPMPLCTSDMLEPTQRPSWL